MTSMLYLSRYSPVNMNNLQLLHEDQNSNFPINLISHPITTVTLKYSNKHVTQRLHRYRYMKKQWQKVVRSVQNISSFSSTCGPSIIVRDTLPITHDTMKHNPTLFIQKPFIESKAYCISRYIDGTPEINDTYAGNAIEFDPLYLRIQQDLIKLRKSIKTKQRKSHDEIPDGTLSNVRSLGELTSKRTTFDNQENNTIEPTRKALPSNKLQALDHVKISGCQMQTSIQSKCNTTTSGIGNVGNLLTTCSQYSKPNQREKVKRQYNNETSNTCYDQVNHSTPSFDSTILRVSHLSKKKSNTSSKITQNIRLKQSQTSCLSLLVPRTPSIVKKKQPNFTKQEIQPSFRRFSQSRDITTCPYTYAASSSSVIPRSMMLKRTASLLPILMQSRSCLGIQPREHQPNKFDKESEEKDNENSNNNADDDDDYYHLLDYKYLLNRLPKSVIPIYPHYGQDDYGLLFEQLNHIRKTMPNSNIYDKYARTA